MAEDQYILELIDIDKYFPGVQALDHARLRLRPGSVHALMGENGAGKSTLMKCLFGIYNKDSGEITYDGKKAAFHSPKQALIHGVSMVHQELNQVLQRNVMDNIWLGRYPYKNGAIDEKKMYHETKRVFESLSIDIDPREKIDHLSVSQRQMVEISKAVSYNARVIVMDEPSSSLTENEVRHLFQIINKLRETGCAIIYISHKIEEILEISDEVTVMRDGKWVGTYFAKELTDEKIINLMVGRELTNRFPPKENQCGDEIMRVENLSTYYAPAVKDVSFRLRKGEILGIAGLVGSRRTELVEGIFGIRRVASGKIFLHDRQVENKSPRHAKNNGFSLVTEERRATGIFGVLNVKFNIFIANLSHRANKLGILNGKAIDRDVKWVMENLQVKAPSPKTLIRSLSGGNQQKVILGRWLLTEPEVLMLDEPTRGIDVGAKFEIYQLIISLAKRGKGVIMISSEMPELLGVSDRILVMSNGRLAGIVNTAETTQEEIMRLSAKFL